MQNKTCLIFGGTGGVGEKLKPWLNYLLSDYEVIYLGSKDLNIGQPQEVKDIIEKYQPEIVINLASINRDGKIGDQGMRDFYDMTAINCLGGYSILKSTIEFWDNHESQREPAVSPINGTYIYVSSLLSRKPAYGASLYSAFKSFNDSLIKTASLEYGKNHVFSSIQLGFFEGGMCDKLPDKVKAGAVRSIPSQRFCTGEELANTIKYIVDTPYANGSIIQLDGGII